jgi:hypothetical protein
MTGKRGCIGRSALINQHTPTLKHAKRSKGKKMKRNISECKITPNIRNRSHKSTSLWVLFFVTACNRFKPDSHLRLLPFVILFALLLAPFLLPVSLLFLLSCSSASFSRPFLLNLVGSAVEGSSGQYCLWFIGVQKDKESLRKYYSLVEILSTMHDCVLVCHDFTISIMHDRMLACHDFIISTTHDCVLACDDIILSTKPDSVLACHDLFKRHDNITCCTAKTPKLPGRFKPATPKVLAWPCTARLSEQLLRRQIHCCCTAKAPKLPRRVSWCAGVPWCHKL